ncbi:MAG: aminotransferase class III-fold pyridoxal phosphate-dependent enzyme [Pseudomonadota bacterium]
MSQVFPFTDPVAAETLPPLRIVGGNGIKVIDVRGKDYIDAVSALWCSPLGFNHPRLADAAQRQMQTLNYYHSFMGRTPNVTEKLARRLVQKLPSPISHVLFGTSGSEAVETAVKLVRYYQNSRGKSEKMRIVSREGGYHGSGQMSAALTGMGYCHDAFGVPLHDVLRVGRPHYLCDAQPGETEVAFVKRLGRELDETIRDAGPETVGGFIGEPIMGSGGVILPPNGYWEEIQNVLSKHDVLLIADEIITGFGRTGVWFACELFGIQPDLLTMAKQMTAAVFPMSAVALSEKVYAKVATQAHQFGTFGHGVTYGGHPVGAAVAMECLDIYEDMCLPNHVTNLGAYMGKGLALFDNMPCVAQVRREGMLSAVEFADCLGSDFATRVTEEARERGVFFRNIGNILAIAPPYICTQEDIDAIFDVLLKSVDAVLAETERHHELA